MFHVASAGMGGGSALCRPLQNPVWHGASEMLTSLASLNLLLSGVEDPANVWGWEAECRSIPIYSSCPVLSLLRAQVPLMPASPGSSSVQISPLTLVAPGSGCRFSSLFEFAVTAPLGESGIELCWAHPQHPGKEHSVCSTGKGWWASLLISIWEESELCFCCPSPCVTVSERGSFPTGVWLDDGKCCQKSFLFC